MTPYPMQPKSKQSKVGDPFRAPPSGQRLYYRRHGLEIFVLLFDPFLDTLPSHAKANTHGKRAPG